MDDVNDKGRGLIIKSLISELHHILKRPDNKRPDSFSNVLTVSQTSWQKFQFDTILPNVLTLFDFDEKYFWKKLWFLNEVVLLLKSGTYVYETLDNIIWKQFYIYFIVQNRGRQNLIGLDWIDFLWSDPIRLSFWNSSIRSSF